MSFPRSKKKLYTEGELLWLDVDTKIRELTQDRRIHELFVDIVKDNT